MTMPGLFGTGVAGAKCESAGAVVEGPSPGGSAKLSVEDAATLGATCELRVIPTFSDRRRRSNSASICSFSFRVLFFSVEWLTQRLRPQERPKSSVAILRFISFCRLFSSESDAVCTSIAVEQPARQRAPKLATRRAATD